MGYNVEMAERIAEIASSASAPIEVYDLADSLGYGHSRGIFAAVSAAYAYFESIGDERTSTKIAHTFVHNGVYEWA